MSSSGISSLRPAVGTPLSFRLDRFGELETAISRFLGQKKVTSASFLRLPDAYFGSGMAVTDSMSSGPISLSGIPSAL